MLNRLVFTTGLSEIALLVFIRLPKGLAASETQNCFYVIFSYPGTTGNRIKIILKANRFWNIYKLYSEGCTIHVQVKPTGVWRRIPSITGSFLTSLASFSYEV